MPLSTTNVHASTLWLTSVVEINRRIKETLERAANLSVTQYRILLELRINENHLACGTLATLLFLSPAAVTHAVDYLYHRGFVTREVMESNRRVTLIDETEAGRTKLAEADEALVTMLRRDVWSNLTPEQHNRLVYSCSISAGPFVGHTLLHEGVPVEPCYITCALIQQQCYDQLLAELGLTMSEFRVGLYALDKPEGLRSTDFADALLLNRSNTSRAVMALKKRGIFESAVCKNDSRASLLSLTPAGAETIRHAFGRMTTLDNSICLSIKTPRAEELNEINEHINAALRAAAERDRG